MVTRERGINGKGMAKNVICGGSAFGKAVELW